VKEETSSRAIEWFILFSALLIVIFFMIFGMREKVGGAIAGGLVAYGNYVAIKAIILRAFRRQDKIRFAIAVLYGVKFLAIILIVYLLVSSRKFDMLGFLAGISSLLLGIVCEGIRRAIWES